ncbi:50S ribosomal protein L10 [Mycobacterium kansasii]|uniref:50S ribosomal protein L10 n=1 Tax=Mycobacterium kansasii TaxID=1768 RepID=A0A1V3WFE6_MYCKA|nr:50S ribosomal protein L10 [Mycobacterium kansasii]
MARADKATAVADIAERFKASTATVITEYRGLTVANLAQLRRSLGESATYAVAKNTLIKRAASEAGIDGLDELFAGPRRSRSSPVSRSTRPRPSRPSPGNTRRWSSRAATWTATR